MSASSENTIYLISGANRGIGLAVVKAILNAHPAAFVYAGARDVKRTNVNALRELQKQYPERMAIVKCVSADVEGNAALARDIEGRHGRVDTVIANAGISENVGSVLETPLSNVEDHFRVNMYGPLVLFQATHALLKRSSNTPKFITITSLGGCIDGLAVKNKTIGTVGYGASKAALNWVTRKIHFENEWLVAFPLSPGMVDTDMFQNFVASDKTGAFATIMHLAARPDDAGPALLDIIDRSTREEHGGQLFNVDGSKADW